MVLAATCMWGINGTVSKAILDSSHGSGLSALRLTEVRSTGAALVLGAFLMLSDPRRLRVRRDEVLFLLAFGVLGLAAVQWFYYFAYHRLNTWCVLLIQYLEPL